jgi:FkbM family methyltransferase
MMRAKWRAVLDQPGRRRVLALLESAAYSRYYRRPVWLTNNGPYWVVRAWRSPTVVSNTYRWEGPDLWRNLTAELLYYRYRPVAGDVVVDIGAGMGEELPYLSEAVSPRGRVVAIEAHPLTYNGLLRSISLNRLTNCEPVAAAISDHTGVTMISNLADLDANTTVASDASDLQLEVKALTLDDLCERQSIDQIDLLKMNIEGGERLAIRGMSRVLAQTRDVVVSCHDFLAARLGDESLKTKELIMSALTTAGFDVETREDDRAFVADYVYGTRARTG